MESKKATISRFSEAGSVVDKVIAQKEVWDGHASGGRKRGVRGVSSMRKRSGSGGSGHRHLRGGDVTTRQVGAPHGRMVGEGSPCCTIRQRVVRLLF